MSGADTGVTVAGVGTATSVPDVMRVDIGVSVRADTVADASTRARHQANGLIESLVAGGVQRQDIATRSYDIHPEYDHTEGGQRLLGFRVGNEFGVTIRDVSTAGTVLDRAVVAAGDALTVNRVQMRREDETEDRDRAREAAWADAEGRARHLAQLAGRQLGPVVSIVESTGQAPPVPMARMALAEATPIEAGEATTTVTLEVRFELV